MRYRPLIQSFSAPCPIEGCDEEIDVVLEYAPTRAGLDIDVTYPTLDLHLVEHGMAPVPREADPSE